MTVQTLKNVVKATEVGAHRFKIAENVKISVMHNTIIISIVKMVKEKPAFNVYFIFVSPY